MASLSYDGLSEFTPEQQRVLRRIIDSHNGIAMQTNANPVGGSTPAPLPHASLTVEAGDGMFKGTITPSSNNYRGVRNMVEASEDPNFTSVHLIHLGPSNTFYEPLGEKTLHFRSFAQHDTSAPSEPVYVYDVNGAGGTAPTVGSSSQPKLTGYGKQPYNTPTPPKRRSV